MQMMKLEKEVILQIVDLVNLGQNHEKYQIIFELKTFPTFLDDL